jgi:hypothetical protein
MFVVVNLRRICRCDNDLLAEKGTNVSFARQVDRVLMSQSRTFVF